MNMNSALANSKVWQIGRDIAFNSPGLVSVYESVLGQGRQYTSNCNLTLRSEGHLWGSHVQYSSNGTHYIRGGYYQPGFIFVFKPLTILLEWNS